MGKGKLNKFAEMRAFVNVFQPEFDEVFQKDFKLKGQWNKSFFKNENPIVLELGCGKGDYTVGLAERIPDTNFIGVDIKGARIWKGAKYAVENNLPNVAFIRTRIELIDSFFGGDEIHEIWLTFPDPQLKKRRNKKRLTGLRYFSLYQKFLRDDGIIHLKTDNAVLFDFTRDLIVHNNLEIIHSTSDLYHSDLEGPVRDIQTFYEKQFLEENLKIHYLCFRLKQDIDLKEFEQDG